MFIVLQISSGSGNIKNEFNTLLEDYAAPIVGVILLLSVIAGLLSNMEKISDSEGRGTRKEGLLNVVYIVGGVILVLVVIGAVITLINGNLNLKL